MSRHWTWRLYTAVLLILLALGASSAFAFGPGSLAGGVAPYLINFSRGFTTYFISTSIARTFFGGTDKATATAGSGSNAGVAKIAIGLGTAGTSVIFNNGTKGTNATGVAENTGTPYYGNRAAGDRALNGLARRAVFSNRFGQFDNLTRVP